MAGSLFVSLETRDATYYSAPLVTGASQLPQIPFLFSGRNAISERSLNQRRPPTKRSNLN
jgi:hypothetical protein